MPTTVSKQII